MRQQFVRRTPAADFFECVASLSEIRQDELLGERSAFGKCSRTRTRESLVRAIDQRDVPDVGDRRPIAEGIGVERTGDPATQVGDAGAGCGGHEHGVVVVPRRGQVDFICNAKNF